MYSQIRGTFLPMIITVFHLCRNDLLNYLVSIFSDFFPMFSSERCLYCEMILFYILRT